MATPAIFGGGAAPASGRNVPPIFGGQPAGAAPPTPPVPVSSVTTGAPPSSHGGGGVLGAISRIPGDFVGHIVPDVEGAVIGTGRLVKNIVAPGTHPSWGQLVHEWEQAITHPGSIFSHAAIAADPLATQLVETGKGTLQVAEHPLRDPFATALLGYGAGAGLTRVGLATKAGLGGETAELAAAKPLGTLTARAAEGGAPVTVRTLPRDPFIAARMKAVDKALKRLPATTPMVGEFSRAARSVERSAKVPYLKALADPRLATYQRALGKLGKVERVALASLARVPLPADLEAWKGVLRGQNTEVAAKLADVLSDPALLERYTGFQRFPKIVAAHEAAKNLVAANEEIGLRTGALTPETIAASPFIATQVARGAEFKGESVPISRETPAGTTIRVVGQRAEGKLVEVGAGKRPTAVVFYPRFGRAMRLPLGKLEEVTKPSLVGGGTPEGIAAEISAAGRPEPIKLPDTTLAARESMGGESLGSGRTPPGSPTRRSTGALMRTGNLDLTTDRLTPHFLATARYEAKLLKHDLVKRAAQAVPKGEGLPSGMEWVRATRGEKIPHLESVKVEHLSELDRIFPDEEHPFTLSDEAARKDPSLIETNAAGDRLVVSKQFADGLAHQYRNEGKAVRWFFTKPLDVWRALVLNLRIPWLVNNIVGNNLLYALRFAGNGGLRAYVDMLRDVRPGFAKRLLNSAPSRTLSPADLAEVFPEQTRGTFIGTQLPTGKLGKFTKPVRALNAGLAPLDRRTEQFLRRGGVNTVLRNSPEAKAIYKAMPRQTRNWREAMLQAVHPATPKAVDYTRSRIAGKLVDDAGKDIGPNDWIVLYHGTTPERATEIGQRGFVRGGKVQRPATVIESEAVAKMLNRNVGDTIGYEPGRGQGSGTYLAISPDYVRQTFGENVVPVKVRVSELSVPPERAHYRNETPLKSLLLDDGYVAHAIPRDRIGNNAVRSAADLRDLTVREVNDALGDYLSLGPFERGVLRRAAPFYGWYREITRIAAHTIVDRPLRALILTRLGQLESDKQEELRGAFPSFLQGSLALGAGPNGTENLLALRSANPLSTTVDLGRAAAFFANPTNRSNAEALLGLTNPYAEAAAATAFGSARADVASPAYLGPAATALNKFGLPGSVLAQVAGGLPQVQALFPPPPSRLYPTRSQEDIILRLLGDIRRQPSLQQAHYYAQQGR